jgi:thioredoxin-like negative regulator of GroEL
LPAADRVRLAPVPVLVGFAFTLGAVFAAVFPTRQEYAHLADEGAPDAYSLAYLQVLTRANPDDEHLRLIYVRQLSRLGRYDEALAALGPAASDRQGDAEAQGLVLDLLLARARAVPEGDPARREAFEGVVKQLRKLRGLHVQSVDRLGALERLALELEEPRLAADFARSAAQSASDGAPLLADAARWMRAAGDASSAANLYREAAEKEHDTRRAQADALEAIAALESEDRVSDAADLAGVFASTWREEPRILVRAADLSLRCGRTFAARDYGRRLVAIDPASEVILEQQVRLELATGDARAALPLAQQLLERRPDDAHLHRTHARIAEWAGRPGIALSEWMWLLERDRGADPGALLAREAEAP